MKDQAYFADHNGQKCQNPHNAVFIVPRDMVIVPTAEQKFCLVPKDLQLTPELKAKHQKNFTDLPLSARALLKHNYEKNLAECRVTKEQCMQTYKACKDEFAFLQTQEEGLLADLKNKCRHNQGIFTKFLQDLRQNVPHSIRDRQDRHGMSQPPVTHSPFVLKPLISRH